MNSPKSKHGMAYTRIYKIWGSMRERCKNPNSKNYGARGIKVCDRWNSFENFYEDMKEGYLDTLTIDRIDVNGDYCPENCRWATMKEQARNKRNSFYITYKGQKKTTKEWAEILGINRQTIQERINTYGFTPEEALETPVESVYQDIKLRKLKKDEGIKIETWDTLRRSLEQNSEVKKKNYKEKYLKKNGYALIFSEPRSNFQGDSRGHVRKIIKDLGITGHVIYSTSVLKPKKIFIYAPLLH